MEKINELGLKYYHNRDDQSFTEFFNYYKPFAYNFARKYYRSMSHAEIENTVSEFFYNILDKIDQYKPHRGKFSSWSYSILANLCLFSVSRDKYRQSEHKYDEELLQFHSDTETFNDIITKEDREHLDWQIDVMLKHLDELPLPYSVYLRDRYINGMTINNLMEKYDEGENTVKTRLHQGIIKLRKSMGIKKIPFKRRSDANIRIHQRTVRQKTLLKKQWDDN